MHMCQSMGASWLACAGGALQKLQKLCVGLWTTPPKLWQAVWEADSDDLAGAAARGLIARGGYAIEASGQVGWWLK
jgi:hypothetical protein